MDNTSASKSMWDLEITELTGHNLESNGRQTVNALLKKGWRLLHIYTLKYKDESDNNGVWRERPMAILGKQKLKSKKRAVRN